MGILYIDGSAAGVSGDMILGAAVDLGLTRERLVEALGRLELGGYVLDAQPVVRSGIRATKVTVRLSGHDHHHRGLAEILSIIDNSSLSAGIKERSSAVFRKLVSAEAGIHGVGEEQVHLHEVGAVDAIVDVVGAMIAFEELGITCFAASPIRLGYGSVKAAHGLLPVPAPATLELLKGIPVFGGDVQGEFTTPTGAAIVASLCDTYGPIPAMRTTRIGYGAGSKDPQDLPNVLRLILGEAGSSAQAGRIQTVEVMEATVDDMNLELCGHLFEVLFEDGALEVFLNPVQMKKSRPGIQLTVLCDAEHAEKLRARVFAETTTLGIRYHRMDREVLDRRHVAVQTPFGEVTVKEALRLGRVVNYAPEFEDCRRAARQSGASLKDVYAAAVSRYLETKLGGSRR